MRLENRRWMCMMLDEDATIKNATFLMFNSMDAFEDKRRHRGNVPILYPLEPLGLCGVS